MQTTLLGLAIAIILALLVALVGPFVVDWNDYRATFEREASRMAGVDVRITGRIDGRLLPSPRLSLKDVEIGKPGQNGIRARALDIEFGLGPLMRGEWRAVEMRLAGPDVSLGIDEAGHIRAPGLAINFDPNALSIERLTIEDGTLGLTDAASGSGIVLEKVWFNGEVRSLLGPVKGEGAVTLGGRLFPFRISTGRFGADGTLKLHLNVDPPDYPLAIEADGIVTVSNAEPRYEGTLGLTRPVGLNRGGEGDALTQPWRVGGKLKVTAKAALMELVEFHYGSGEQALSLTGTADFRFGQRPRFDGVVSGRQIDLDRVLANGDGSRVPPAASVRSLIKAWTGALRPSFPVRLGVGVDLVTLGGASIQNVRGDIAGAADGWLLDRFEFRAPGLTQVRLSGQLAVASDVVSFSGPADISTGDPRALAGWLQGTPPPASVSPGSMRVRGDLTLGGDRIAIDRLRAEFDREAVTGRLAYVYSSGNKPARLEAELSAPQLDLDAIHDFTTAVSQGFSFERPREVLLTLDIGRAIISGYEARQANVRLRFDADGLQVDSFSVADFGGASFSASGKIALGAAPTGSLVLDLDARDLRALSAAAEKYAPVVADRMRRAAGSLVPAKLSSTLTVESVASMRRASIAVRGKAGALKVELNGQTGGNVALDDLSALAASEIRLQGSISADDGSVLAAILGLDRLFTVGKTAGELKFTVVGSLLDTLAINGRLTGSTLDLAVDGTAKSVFGSDPRASMSVKIARADASLFSGGVAGMLIAPLPVMLSGKLAVSKAGIRFDDIAGRIAGSVVRGHIASGPASVYGLSGEVSADSIDLSALMAAAAGMPPSAAQSDNWSWPKEPFAPSMMAGYSGRISIRAARAALSANWIVRDIRATLRFGDGEFALENFTGHIAGGRVEGELATRVTTDGLAAQIKISLTGADAAMLTPGAIRAPIAGRLGLTIKAEGSGLSPVTLIGSLNGSGSVSLETAQLAGLDPGVFDTVARSSERDAEADMKKIAALAGRALEAGHLAVNGVTGDVVIRAGQLRINNVTMKGDGAELTLSGRLDLNDGTLDARLALAGPADAGVHPTLYLALRGPLSDPARSLDVSALAGWLTMRSIERQAKQLKAIEAMPERGEGIPARAQDRSAQPVDVMRRAPALAPPIEIAPAPSPANNTPLTKKDTPAPRTTPSMTPLPILPR